MRLKQSWTKGSPQKSRRRGAVVKYTVVVCEPWRAVQLLTIEPVERGEAERLLCGFTETWREFGLKPTVMVERTGATTARLVVAHVGAI